MKFIGFFRELRFSGLKLCLADVGGNPPNIFYRGEAETELRDYIKFIGFFHELRFSALKLCLGEVGGIPPDIFYRGDAENTEKPY